MRWIRAKLQLVFGFIFGSIISGLADIRFGEIGSLQEMGRKLSRLEDGIFGNERAKGLLVCTQELINKRTAAFILNKKGKLFPLNDVFSFDVVYDYATEALRFNLLTGHALIETCTLLLKDSGISEEHADYPVLEFGRRILKSPRQVVRVGEKQISYCDDMAIEAMRILGNIIPFTNAVITGNDLWATCNQAFFNNMRYFYGKEEKKALGIINTEADKGLDKMKDAALPESNLKLVDLGKEGAEDNQSAAV